MRHNGPPAERGSENVLHISYLLFNSHSSQGPLKALINGISVLPAHGSPKAGEFVYMWLTNC